MVWMEAKGNRHYAAMNEEWTRHKKKRENLLLTSREAPFPFFVYYRNSRGLLLKMCMFFKLYLSIYKTDCSHQNLSSDLSLTHYVLYKCSYF